MTSALDTSRCAGVVSLKEATRDEPEEKPCVRGVGVTEEARDCVCHCHVPRAQWGPVHIVSPSVYPETIYRKSKGDKYRFRDLNLVQVKQTCPGWS